jgi:hypothetical protein
VPTSDTQLSVYNGALDLVGEYAITSTSDDRPEVRWLNRNWDPLREATIRSKLWQFAKEEHELTNDATYTANSRWTYRYVLPTGWLRVVPPTRWGKKDELPIRYEIKGNYLFTNWGTTLVLNIIDDRDDPADWDPIFAQLMRFVLAEGMAHRFTRKASFLDRIMNMKTDVLDTAEQVEAFETGTEEAAVHDIIEVRKL